jgi:hypothetical protein
MIVSRKKASNLLVITTEFTHAYWKVENEIVHISYTNFVLQMINTRDQDNTKQHIQFSTKEQNWKDFRNRN